MSAEAPKRFGKCRLLKRLGTGATAIVFLARHEVLEMPVAVKVLRRKLSRERPEYAERFLREARMAARLDHPNIVRVSDCGIEHGYHYMVQDYVDGPDCSEKVQDGPLPWREAIRIVQQAAQGLAYAASHGVIHRDVKPSNIMIDSTGRARITDLGLAKLSTQGVAALTQELHTVGTPNYMSPEQISNPNDLDLRADIYSLGASLYHMVTGRPPFEAKNPMKVVASHLTKALVPPQQVNPEVPGGLSAIVCKMMAKSRKERYQDYADLCADLDNLLEGRDVGARGFTDSQEVGLDEDELREVLEELSFAEGLEIEADDDDDEDRALIDSTPEQGDDEKELSDAYIFRPEDNSTYLPPSEQTPASFAVYRRRRSRADNWANILGVAAIIIVLLVIVGMIALMMAPAGGSGAPPNAPATEAE